MRPLALLLLLATSFSPATAQNYTLLIKGGYVIDPKSNLHDTVDIALKDNLIARIAKNIDPRQATRIIDARGDLVCPGLIDIHTHTFFGSDPDNEYVGGTEAVIPDSIAPKEGVTTLVDAGSSGWRNFQVFKKRVIDRSTTRVLAFLNIVGAGMHGEPYEQDTKDMSDSLAAATARQYPKQIIGFKVAHYRGNDWHPIDAATRAAERTNLPVMVDFGEHLPFLSLPHLLLRRLRPGDIFTHCFAELSDREPIVDPATRTLKPFVPEAQAKGILFDVGYGEISFAFSQAIPALKDHFLPNSISSDVHRSNQSTTLLTIMSRFLAMGVDRNTVIRMVTSTPAEEIHRNDLGHLAEGGVADIALLRIAKGNFTWSDHTGRHIGGHEKFECIMTIKGGKIVYVR